MSYILDALRKSDQQRQRGAAPKLHAGQAAAVAPKKPALLAYGLIAAALVGAGVVIGWLRPWQAEQAAPGGAQPVAAKPPEPAPRQAAPVPSEVPPQQEPRLQSSSPSRKAAPAPSEASAEPEEPQLQSASPPRKAAHKPAPATAKPRLRPRAEPETDDSSREAKAAVPRNTAAPPPRPERPAGATSADAARAQPVISMAELPLSIQQELPPMTISVHAYSSKPGDSMVGINNRMLREGDEVAPGLKLEQITPEGMIFGYKGYSFRHGVK